MYQLMPFQCIVFLLSVLFPGLYLARMTLKDSRGSCEVLFLSMILSLLVNFYSLAILGYFKLLTRAYVLGTFVIINGALHVLWMKRDQPLLDIQIVPLMNWVKEQDLLNKLMLAFIISILLLESYHSLFFPIYSWDGIVTDSYSKWTYLAQGYPNNGIAWMNHMSFNMAWIYIVFGQFNELLSHFVHILYSYILVYYTYRIANTLKGNGILAAFLVTVYPTFVLVSNSSYMDIPFAAFIVVCLHYLLDALNSRTSSIPLLGFLIGSLIITKPHGLYFFMLPFVYLLFAYRKRIPARIARRNTVLMLAIIILVFIPVYLANNLLIPDYYSNLFWNQPGRPALWVLSVGDHIYNIGQQFGILAKPVMGLLVLAWAGPLPTIPICYVLFAFSLGYLFKRRRCVNDIDLLYVVGLPYILIYFFMLSYDPRYSLHWLPIFAVIASSNITALIKRRGGNGFRVMGLLLIFLLPTIHFSLELAVWGRTVGLVGGPYLTWAVTHPFIPLEEKKEVLLGDMYKTARFVNNNPDMKGATVGVVDARQINYIFNATFKFGYMSSVHELMDLDYVILPLAWSERFLGFDLSTVSLKDDTEGITRVVYSSGDIYVLKINKRLRAILDIRYGGAGIRPTNIPFCLTDMDYANRNIWIEAEDFSIIQNGNSLPNPDPSVANSSNGRTILFSPKEEEDVSDAINTRVTLKETGKYSICIRFYTSEQLPGEETALRIVLDEKEHSLISNGTWEWTEQCIDVGVVQHGNHSITIIQAARSERPWIWIDAIRMCMNGCETGGMLEASAHGFETAWGKPTPREDSAPIAFWQDDEGWHVEIKGVVAEVTLQDITGASLDIVRMTAMDFTQNPPSVTRAMVNASQNGELLFKSDNELICITDVRILPQS